MAFLSDPRFALPVLMLCMGLLTGQRVFTEPLWGDEFRTWRDGIEKPLRAVLTWTHNADHAPLGHLLARAGAAVFGVEHAWALRLGAWLCGLTCVPAIWWMGRTIWSNGAGLLMATMLVVDPNHVYQMTQARMYAPLMLAAVVSLALAGSILIRPDKPWTRVALLGLSIGLGIWAHAQIYALVLAMVVLSFGLLATRRKRVAMYLACAVLVGLGIGAQGVWKIAHRHDAEAVVAADITDAPGGQLEDAFHQLTGAKWLTYLVFAGGAAGLALMARSPKHRPVVALAVLLVALAVINVLVAARYRPVAHARYLMILQPALWLAMAVLLVELWQTRQQDGYRQTLAWAGAAMLVGTSVFQIVRVRDALVPHPLARPFAEAAQLIQQKMGDTDRFAVVARSPYGMYTRYYGLTLDSQLDDGLRHVDSARVRRERLDAAETETGSIWLLCVVPPKRDAKQPYAKLTDDPRWIVAAIAERRTLPADSLNDLGQGPTWKTVVLKIDSTLSRPAPPFVAE